MPTINQQMHGPWRGLQLTECFLLWIIFSVETNAIECCCSTPPAVLRIRFATVRIQNDTAWTEPYLGPDYM